MFEDGRIWGALVFIINAFIGIVFLFFGSLLGFLLMLCIGIALLIIAILTNKDLRDKKTVYEWLHMKATKEGHHELTIGNYNDDRWQTIEDISDGVNLIHDRVKHICSIDKRIRRQKEGEYPIPQYKERWGLREFVGNGKPPKKDTPKKKSRVKPSVDDITDKEWEDESLIPELLDKCFYKEDLQAILRYDDLLVSGNKDELIERIIEAEIVDVPNLIEIMDKNGLITMCEMFDLDTTGNKPDLKKRILKTKGIRGRT